MSTCPKCGFEHTGICIGFPSTHKKETKKKGTFLVESPKKKVPKTPKKKPDTYIN